VGVRSFGSDKETVTQFASAAVRGFQSGNVAACAKHFPGLGDTAIDTHLALATLTIPVEQVMLNDLLPYRVAIDAGLASIMTTHTVFAEMDDAYPATLSPVVIEHLLRKELQFDNVVTTDCMEMKAISDNFGTGESAVLAMLAGVDIVLFSHTRELQEAASDAMLDAAQSWRVSEAIIDAANVRIARMKAQFPAKVGDLSSIRSENHLNTVNEAAKQAIVMFKNDGIIPLDTTSRIGLIEFASYLDSIAVEDGGLTGLGEQFIQVVPTAETIAIRVGTEDDTILEKALSIASNSDILVLATRNAHLWTEELELAKTLLATAPKSALLALRNPYDVVKLDADAVLCTCGDAEPSLIAVVAALLGEFVPAGKLPVEIAE
jgi:beta-N-acetylhexosaminidase